MTRDIEEVQTRWMRRNASQRFRLYLFSEFEVREMEPGTHVYARMGLAIALQQAWHSLRAGLRPLLRRLAPSFPRLTKVRHD